MEREQTRNGINETKPIYQTKQERNRDLFLDNASEVNNSAPSLLGPLAHLPPSVHCSILGIITHCAQGQNTPKSALVQNSNSSILPFPLLISHKLIKRRKRKYFSQINQNTICFSPAFNQVSVPQCQSSSANHEQRFYDVIFFLAPFKRGQMERGKM